MKIAIPGTRLLLRQQASGLQRLQFKQYIDLWLSEPLIATGDAHGDGIALSLVLERLPC